MMGEEVFQLHVATPTYAPRPMSLYKARQEKRPTGSFFPAHHYRVFPCWYATGSSFPAGVQESSLLVLYKFPTLNFVMVTKQNGHWS